MIYYSKKDAWLLVLLWGSVVLCFSLGFLFLALPGIPAWAKWLLLLEGVLIGAFILLLVTTTYYEITPTALRVYSCWLHRDIELETIQQVFPTHNPLSAPALSLDRLQVDYVRQGRARFALISPEDRFGFMQSLVAQTPDLEVRDGRVVRRQ